MSNTQAIHAINVIDVLSISISVINLILLMCVFFAHFSLNLRPNLPSLRKTPTLHESNSKQEEIDQLTISEKVVLREQEYDKRIQQIKDELSLRNSSSKRQEVVADELHPDVKNLPHSIISSGKNTYSDVEVAD